MLLHPHQAIALLPGATIDFDRPTVIDVKKDMIQVPWARQSYAAGLGSRKRVVAGQIRRGHEALDRA